jgi:DNA (cytosine-5)-methyltransferase 1
MGYHRAGFEVVGVDINSQNNYPFEFWQEDALWHMRFWRGSGFDAIHASPPCQAFSSRTPDRSKHPDLITPLRPLLEATGLPYIIENVPGAPLRDPVKLCGSSFGLRVRRERLFETNFSVVAPACEHEWQDEDKRYLVYDHRKWFWTGVVPVYGSGGRKAVEYWPHAMGCGETWDDCWMTRDELAEAIPPAYTEYIGFELRRHLEEREAA